MTNDSYAILRPKTRHAWRGAAAAEIRQPGWLMTFVDLVSLLLAFFVLMFAMSAPDRNQWQRATGSIVEALGGAMVMRDVAPPDRSSMEPAQVSPRGLDLGYLERLLGEKLAAAPELGTARLRRFDGRLVLSLPNELLFAGGDATLSAAGRAAVFALSVALDTVVNRLQVRGHTDPRPLAPGGRFNSNWELSLARALSVAEAMRAAGMRKPVSVRGVADGHYAADLPAADTATRAAFARRVDIVFGAGRDR